MQDIKTSILAAALPKPMSDGNMVPTLTVDQTQELALRLATDNKTIEIAALQEGIMPVRYARNFNVFDYSDQICLLQSRVTVVGLGGLGGTVIECLARAGVGHLSLIDGDRFEDHNLNRQLLSSQDRLGTSKVASAAERIRQINSSTTVQVFNEFLTSANASGMVRDSDVVVDCLDSIEARFTLEAASKAAQLPMVSAALAGLCGHVTTIYPQDQGLSLIYGNPDTLKASKGAETVLGCLPQAVVLVAAAESAEVVKVLLAQESNTLRNRMLMVDVTSNTYEVLRLA